MTKGGLRLGGLCHTVTKGTTPTSLGYGFSNEGIPFLRIQNLGNNTVTLDDVLYIDEGTHRALKRSIIKPGDFLITIAGTIGRVAIVPDDFPECNCNQAVAILRFDQKKLWPKFLMHWLSTNDALGQISGKKVTATISNLSLGQIKELNIPLPPLVEQKRIAAILDKADSIRRKRQQAIQLADEFLRSVFLDMFGDPVTNPKGWGKKELGKLIKLSSGNSLVAKNMDLAGKYLVYGGNGVNGKHSKYMFEHPQLTIGRVGVYCGAIHITESKSWITDNALYVKEYLEDINIHYLAQLLELMDLNQYAGKAAQPLVSGNRIYPLEAIFPPLELQYLFESIKKKVHKSFGIIYESNESISELFESLSQQVFSGNL